MIQKLQNEVMVGAMVVIAGGGIFAAQAHGVGFWIGVLGSVWLGWLVSLTLEGASIVLWWRGDPGRAHRAGKWFATGALMAGMVAESAVPLLKTLGTGAVATKGLKILGALTANEKWIRPDTLDKVLDAAAAAPALQALPDALAQWVPLVIVAGLTLIIPGVYALALLFVSTLGAREMGPAHPWTLGEAVDLFGKRMDQESRAGNQPPGDAPPGTELKAPFGGQASPEKRLALVFAEREGIDTSEKGWQKPVADALGESEADISMFVRHRKLVANGKRRVSEAGYERIKKKLGPAGGVDDE